MIVDFSKVDAREQPVLILKNTSGTPLGVLGSASNVAVDIKYNEVSTLDFNLPAYADGTEIPNYNGVIGMRVIDLQDVGQFILMNPKETGDGIKRIKACKAYSLEYEFTFKKITLENGTYNFWNPVAPSGTILGIILELMPSWSVGTVDSSLIGKYRTYEVSDENLYNFMKSTLQQSYSCIFDFDTYNRRINIRDVSSFVPTNPIFISLDNLAKEISIEEDTESIITRLDVNGAEGVDIRDVNPTGNNKIINLDYYMTTDNFSQSTIGKYFNWKSVYKSYQTPYYNLSIEYSLQVMRKTTEAAALIDLEGEMTSLENQQAVIIRAIAQNLDPQSSLNNINSLISAKQSEINAKKLEIASIEHEIKSTMTELVAINEATNFRNCFNADEYVAIDRFIKDDSVSESSFVVQETSSYSTSDYGNKVSSGTLYVRNSNVTKTVDTSSKSVYEIQGGTFQISGLITSNIIRGIVEKSSNGSFLMTAYLGNGSINSDSYDTACVSLSGTCGNITSASSATLTVRSINSYLYLTLNTSEYAKRSVAWDLFEYGNDVLEKISQPSFRFSVTSANFLFIDEFGQFKNVLKQGEKLYVGLSDDNILAPIAIGLRYEYDSPQSLSFEFSDKYVSGDSSFLLADLLEQSVSMGKNVDISKFTYSAFVDSGAHTQVKDFMHSALDVAKNAIMSSKDQAITWGDSGIRLRKWTDENHTAYDPCQVWMNNNSILMTSNNWSTAELAIGNFYDKNIGNCWGVVAPNIVGTLLAGSNLVVESAKKDGGVAVFKVDASGCVLHNSEFSITSDATNTHILLDAAHGIALGTYPLINSNGTINENNYKFWVDGSGNLFFKGTLKATTGEFTGKVTATSGYIGGSSGWTIESTYIYNGKPSYTSGNTGVYIGTDGISIGTSTYYIKLRTSDGQISANNVNISGSVTAISGSIGGCSISNGVLQVAAANITSGTINTARIPNLSADKITTGTLNGNNVSVANLRADSITVGKLSAGQISGLPASQITSGQFSTSRIPNLSADKITTGTLDANNVNIANLTVGTAQITGTLSASKINGGSLSGCSINIGSGTFYVNSSGFASMAINSLRVYSNQNVGTLGVGYHYGQTFEMHVVRNVTAAVIVSKIIFVFVQGICCGYYNEE